MESVRVDKGENITTPTSQRQFIPSTRRASQNVSIPPQGDTSKQLHTLINGETGHIVGKIRLAPLPSLQALLELDEMSFNEFDRTLKTGNLSELVVIKPMLELNSSSLLDDAVLDDTKTALSARSGSAILRDPTDPFYSLIKEFQDVSSKQQKRTTELMTRSYLQ